MYTEKTIDKERVLLRLSFEDKTSDEKAFLEGALFALDWVKTGIVTSSPSKFIEWRRRIKNNYIAPIIINTKPAGHTK
ncbi:MAG: hypothetical protein ABSG01_09040 [Anaerolineales bacterium]|jgi:hypothetical protein